MAVNTAALNKQQKMPRVGPWPKSVINWWADDKGATMLPDGITGRQQPAVWQELAEAYFPTRFNTGDNRRAIRGDLLFGLGFSSPVVFNGATWEQIGLSLGHRLLWQDRAHTKPQLASVRKGLFNVGFEYVAASIDKRFFTAPAACIVRSAKLTATVAGTDGGAVNVMVEKCPSGTAIGSGADCFSGTLDLKTAANTTISATLGTLANYTLAAGDALGADFTGTLTAATGSVTVELEWLEGDANADPNHLFSVAGTASANALVVAQATGGYRLTTSGADDAQMILIPKVESILNTMTHLPSGFPTFECIVRTGNGANFLTKAALWAGLKLTNTRVVATDDDQAFILFDAEDGSYTTTFIAVFSIANVDYKMNTGVTVAKNAVYHLKVALAVDANGKTEPVFWIDGTQVAKGSDHASWVKGTTTMTAAAALKPFMGVQALEAAAHYFDYLGASGSAKVA